MQNGQLVGLLGRYCADLGVPIDPEALVQVVAYVEALIEANQRVNLTSISAPEEALRLHALDSLAAAPEVASAPAGTLLDVGSGGGIPGVPLALQSERNAVLLDSVRKKMAAVQVILDQMGLGATISTEGARAEDHARSHRAAYAVVTTRAVSALNSLAELASPLLAEGGRFVALKGQPGAHELASGREVAEKVGMREVSVRRFLLPGGGEARTIVCYERVGRPLVALPRRTGLAQHHPLA
jgi:16S rRNA (guanine527-N7)-methyltransferase